MITSHWYLFLLLAGLGDLLASDVVLDHRNWPLLSPDSLLPSGDGLLTLASAPYQCVGDLKHCDPESGFTVSLWLLPHTGISGSGVLLTTGGTDLLSSGYYLRQLSEERYVVGVAEDDHQWLVHFSLHPDQWSHVAWTWSKVNGIELYVDGFFVESREQGEERRWEEPAYPYFPYLRVRDSDVTNVSFWEGILQPNEIVDAYTADHMFSKGCVTQLPEGADEDSHPVPAGGQQTYMCRQHCAHDKHRYALVRGGDKKGECVCVDDEGDVGKCSDDTTEWRVSVATNAFQEKKMGTLSVRTRPNIMGASGGAQAGEVVKIYLYAINRVVPDYVWVNFGDGQEMETTDTELEHVWDSAGRFKIKIKAYHNGKIENLKFRVKITESRTGEAARIEHIQLSGIDGEPSAVAVELIAIGKPPMLCSLTFQGKNGAENRTYPENALSLIHINETVEVGAGNEHHFYTYCKNADGEATKNATVTLSQVEFKTIYMETSSKKGEDVQVPNNSTDLVQGNLLAYLDLEPVNTKEFMIFEKYITIPASNFLCTGQHLLTIDSDYDRYEYNIHIDVAIRGFTSSIQPSHLSVNETAEVTIQVPIGSNVIANINFGDGNVRTFSIYEDSTSLKVHHSYKQAGTYNILVAVGNAVSYQRDNHTVFVQHTIDGAVLRTADVRALSDPVPFALFFNSPDTSSKVKIHIDYGDGRDPYSKVMSGFPKEGLKFTHLYEDYGKYKVKGSVSNEISEVEVEGDVQVGEFVTDVGIIANQTHINIGEEMSFTVSIPDGVPVTYLVDYGDGTREESKYENYTQVMTPKTHVLKHVYNKVGEYRITISASNVFGEVENQVCHRVVVTKPRIKTPSCARPTVTFNKHTTPDAQLQVKRSDSFTVEANVSYTCEGQKHDERLSYSWIAVNTWNRKHQTLLFPTPQLCLSESSERYLKVEGNTLPYGTYYLQLVAYDGHNLGMQATGQVYVHVKPTPLKLSLAGGRNVEVYYLNDMVIDVFDKAFDPDVFPTNKTGMSFEMFCEPLEEYNETAANTDEVATVPDLSENTKTTKFEDGNSFHEVGPCFLEDTPLRYRKGVIKYSAEHLTPFVQLTVVVRKDGREVVTSQMVAVTKSAFTLRALEDKINNVGNVEDASTEAKDELVNMIANITEFKSIDQLASVSNILSRVTTSSNTTSNTISAEAQEKVSNAVLNMADTLDSFEASKEQVVDVASNLVGSIGNVLDAVDDKFDGNGVNEVDPEKLREEKEDEGLLTDEAKARKAAAEQEKLLKKRNVASKAVKATDKVSNAVLRTQEVDGEPAAIKTPSLEMMLSKESPEKMKEKKMRSAGGGINVPSSVLGKNMKGKKSVSTKFVQTKSNPFVWDKSSSTVKSPVLSLSFEDETGSEVKISDSEEPIVVAIAASGAVPPVYLHIPSPDPELMNVHSVDLLNNDSSLHVSVRPQFSEEISYFVYIRHGDKPTPKEHDYMVTLPHDDEDRDEGMADDMWEELRWMISLSNTNTTEGIYYIGIMPNETQLDFISDKLAAGRIENTDDQTTVDDIPDEEEVINATYALQTFVSGCRYWDTASESWDAAGCYVGSHTTALSTQCICNHLTSFGADFYVPVNTIDFSTVFSKFKDLHNNAAVFSTIVTLLGLYIIGMIWGRHADKKDLVRWGAIPLADNLPTDSYHYLLTLQTGMKKTASTRSKVSFVMSGENGDSGVRLMSDGKKDGFDQGNIRNFILSVQEPLGPLSYLRVWHDNSGKGKMAGWFLVDVQVTDLQNAERFLFICNNWLAVEEGDGRIDRILPATTGDDASNLGYLFSTSMRRKLTDGHIWFSVFSRPTRSNFTRVQRISCCISLLFCTMIANAMFFKGEERVEKVASVQLGPFKFTLHQLYISFMSTLIVFPVNLFQMQLFRKARPKSNVIATGIKSKKFKWKTISPDEALFQNVKKSKLGSWFNSVKRNIDLSGKSTYEEEEAKKQRKKKGKLLPHWVIYMAWCSVFVSITIPAFFTILYSMEWGKEKANEWLITMVLSFVQSVVFIQPVKVILLAFFFSYVLKKPAVDEEEVEDEDATNYTPAFDEELLQNIHKNPNVSHRKMNTATLLPPDNKELDKARDIRMKELQMEAIIKEILTYVMFLLALMFICHTQRHPQCFFMTKSIKELFVMDTEEDGGIRMPYNGGNEEGAVPVTFKITKYNEVIPWLNDTLIPALYNHEWYNGDSDDVESTRLFISNKATVRMGRIVIRQQRISRGECKVKRTMSLFTSCWDGTDSEDYLEGWEPRNETSQAKKVRRKRSDSLTMWDYKSMFQLKGLPYVGEIDTYTGGGYVQELPAHKEQAYKWIAMMDENKWVDRKTMAVFVELAVYSANVNLFGSAQLVTEFTKTGAAFPSEQIRIFRLHNYIGGYALFVMSCQISLIAFMIYFMQKEFRSLFKLKRAYFKSFWNCMEFLIVLFGLTTIGMFGAKQVFAQIALNLLKKSNFDKYVNFQTISFYDEVYGYILSMLMFLSTLKFLRLLRFNKRVSQLADTLRLCGKEYQMYLALFFVTFGAYSTFGYHLFHCNMVGYKNFVATLESIFAFMLGQADYEALTSLSPILGNFYFFSFNWIVVIGVLSIFIGVITDAFATVKNDETLQSKDHEIVEFMWYRFKRMFGFAK